MNTFDAIYVECASKSLSKNQILNSILTNYLTQVVDISSSPDLCNLLTKDELDALMFRIPQGTEYSDNPSSYDKIFMDKLTGLEKVYGSLLQSNQANDSLAHLLFGLKLALFYKICSENPNIKLIGAEPEDYQVGFTSMSSRDNAMSVSLIDNNCRSRNSLFVPGASHGIGLMTNLCRSGRGGFNFVRLIVDKNSFSSEAPFSQWCNTNQCNNFGYSLRPGYGNSFEVKQINQNNMPELQDQEFKSLYKPFKGLVPIPDVSQGSAENTRQYNLPSSRNHRNTESNTG